MYYKILDFSYILLHKFNALELDTRLNQNIYSRFERKIFCFNDILIIYQQNKIYRKHSDKNKKRTTKEIHICMFLFKLFSKVYILISQCSCKIEIETFHPSMALWSFKRFGISEPHFQNSSVLGYSAFNV